MKVKITYLDTAMALIEIGSLRILTDPVLDEAGTTYDDGVISLEKTSAAAISPQELGRIDAVLLSHDQHSDNLDTRGRELLARVSQIVTTPEAAQRLGGRAIGLSPWQETRVVAADGFTVKVTAAPAQHGPDGTEELTGTVTGFLIDWDGRTAQGPIYISGDTVPFAGTAEIVARVAPVGLALLHMGHVSPGPDAGIFFSMSSGEAADYGDALGADVIIPLHFDGWKHFSEPNASAIETLGKAKTGSRTQWLAPRESLDLEM
jgi:L-ascorbate metabolism protein UlaG (beta-lactamase superfamily)